jgi:hypothetical protein
MFAAEPRPDAMRAGIRAVGIDQPLGLRVRVFGKHEIALVAIPPRGEDREFILATRIGGGQFFEPLDEIPTAEAQQRVAAPSRPRRIAARCSPDL